MPRFGKKELRNREIAELSLILSASTAILPTCETNTQYQTHIEMQAGFEKKESDQSKRGLYVQR